MSKRRLVVVGGGAAGFFCAIAAAKADPACDVLLLEKSPELLSKVTLSGGGRCNVTHHCFDVKQLVQNYPRGGRELIGPYHRFQPRDTVTWYESRGVPLKVEEDGRMFPVSDSSASIVNCLRGEAEKAGVRVVAHRGLRSFQPGAGGGFVLKLSDGTTADADRMLLATGGNKATAGYRLAASAGHTIEAPAPSLFSFNINDSSLHALAGISAPDTQVSAPRQRLKQIGPLLITHWGLSGPAALKLSAWGAREFAECDYSFDVVVAWRRGPREALAVELAKMRNQHPKRVVVGGGFDFPNRLWEWFCQRAEIPADRQWAQLGKTSEHRLLDEITACRLPVRGKSMYKDEFVTCGGVRLAEVDFRTMESKVCPGLYFAGELLDIDAVTGGFNFQAAWTTGWIAGHAMVE